MLFRRVCGLSSGAGQPLCPGRWCTHGEGEAMAELVEQERRTAAPSGNGRPIKAGVMPLFSTWIWLCEDVPRHLNEPLEELAHRLMQDDRNAARRTNCGGWHYALDLFELEEPVIDEFHNEMMQHVQAFLNHFRPAQRRKRDRFRLEGWMNVNRAGDYNVLHCHPGSFLSATYYVKIPAAMKGGEIVFRDPRGPAVAMYETPGIDLPWVGSGKGVACSP